MDGFKKRLTSPLARRFSESIQFKLSASLSLAILVVALLAGTFSFFAAFNEAHELQDDTLTQVAALFDRQHLDLEHLGDAISKKNSDEEMRVTVQMFVNEKLADGAKVLSSHDAGGPLDLPQTLANGTHTLEVGGESYRVLVKTTALGERIAVSQETGVRDELARDGAFRTLLPFLILMPILLLVVADLVRKMFRPIATVAAEIDRRTEQSLHPVQAVHLPTEVRPFVVAINHLLKRVSLSMDAQRRFVADAAHELRSPLTAISLQAQRLAETELSELAQERLNTLQLGIERSRNLLDQLLTLAKAQATPDLPKSPISVQTIYRRVLEDLMPLAEAKHIDIGVESAPNAQVTQEVQVLVSELDLITVVKNLVDNAIRYTPEGGKIDLSVSVSEGRTTLHVIDSGPGISASERERVFDPFYRTLGSEQTGSGLGLSIVKTIADRIGAEVRLNYADAARQSGLSVAVALPVVRSSQGN